MNETRATYFCVDIETNGPVPSLYDMVSLGAVVVAPDERGELQLGETFYVELRPVAPLVDPGAVKIHGLDLEHLSREGKTRREALDLLTAWVERHTRAGTKPCFVGHNAPFDWSFVAWTYHVEGLENPFGYKAMCTKSVAMGALGIHWLDTSKEVLSERLKLPAEDMEQKHRADYDALYQAKILLGLLALQG
jgi:DNA polymerase III epsilon subunit-like protein